MSDEKMISGDEICIHKVSKREFVYVRTEAGDRPSSDEEIDVVLYDEARDDETVITLAEFTKWFDVPNPRGDRGDFIQAIKSGEIKGNPSADIECKKEAE